VGSAVRPHSSRAAPCVDLHGFEIRTGTRTGTTNRTILWARVPETKHLRAGADNNHATADCVAERSPPGCTKIADSEELFGHKAGISPVLNEISNNDLPFRVSQNSSATRSIETIGHSKH